MALSTTMFFLLLASLATSNGKSSKLPESDKNLVEFPLNLEYLEAEFYLFAAIGKGLDNIQPNLTGYSGLLGVEAGQDAVIRTLLYERATERVIPYGITVAEFTDRISELRNSLGHAGLKDEGLIVPVSLGADGRTTGNILSANASSLSYGRTPQEVLRILYQTGNEHVAGGFYPRGANGTIARKYLKFE
ncbi:desiccation-related protein PCC13-62 [Artemisia annua]|uniref:Desiccation-related protein PCC13-62 n=1 Tax=Artemisia annua TaxID=35608 RepID=A0A2U1M1T9_ARTAN|nr:desiccation-related protein PCC13-62 [Artemisia annua]